MSVNYPFLVYSGRLCDPHRERFSTTIGARGTSHALPSLTGGKEARRGERERSMYPAECGTERVVAVRREVERHDPMSCCCSCRRDATAAVAPVAVISRRTVFDVGLGTQVIAG